MREAMKKRARRACAAAICAAAMALCAAPAAQGAFDDPLFVFVPNPPKPVPGRPTPPPIPPPTGYFNGPCGLAVDPAGNFYVSDYYHRVVDVFSPNGAYANPSTDGAGYKSQLVSADPLDGPCALGLEASGNLYVNNFHRNVEKFTPSLFPPGFATTYTSAGVFDSAHPTGVAVDPATGNVYVNNRTYISVYDSAGAPVLDGGDPLRIGEGTLGDGYGLALSLSPSTLGRLYVPDAATNTVKVYDPATDTVNPVDTIGGPTGGAFVSLRDSAVAVDRVSGEVYVADDTQPRHTEEPEATIHVFDFAGSYKGHLKYNIVDARPPGLAVDNTVGGSTQGRVYVTSGNTSQAGVYAYPPGAATRAPPKPPTIPLALSASGAGAGSIAADLADIDCEAVCEEQIRSGATVSLTATPQEGSAFAGWSGGGCSGTGACAVAMSEARSIGAEFAALSGPPAPPAERGGGGGALAIPSAIAQKGNLRVTVNGKLSPKRLPRSTVAPIAVSVGGRIATTDASLPPQLKTLRIELNRHGRIDTAGLPTCQYSAIQPGSSSRALAGCRPALVGKGSFTANITLAGQEPYPTKGRLLVFNSLRGGKPILFGHIYSAKPFATSFVIVFKIQRLGRGTFGTALNAPLPKAMDAWGRLTGLQMTLSRRYSHRGARHSFISSGCPAPKGFPGAVFPLARTSFAFAGGKKLTSVFTDTCKVRG
jgi:DNA-binding beta-propeller fold protein YncE